MKRLEKAQEQRDYRKGCKERKEDSGLRKSGKAGKRTLARPVKQEIETVAQNLSKKGAKREGGGKIHQESREESSSFSYTGWCSNQSPAVTSAPSMRRCANSKSYPNGSTDDTTDTTKGLQRWFLQLSTGDACPYICGGHGRSDTRHYSSPTPATNTGQHRQLLQEAPRSPRRYR
jgi:hypothetical protein